MGTPEFAIPSLEALYNNGYDVVGVVTQSDKPKGRGHKMSHPPIYECADCHGSIIFQPENLKKENFECFLNECNPDLIVVVAYGKILPEYVLNFPKFGCINVHGSLLPKYRGAAPMQWCLINGEEKTGVTTMYMEKGLDTGDMLLKSEIELTEDDNYETVHDKLNVLGANLLIETIEKLNSGELVREKQDDSKACYSPMIDKENSKIIWDKSAFYIKNLIRGLYPFPRAHTMYDNKLLKIEKAYAVNVTDSSANGTVIEVGKSYFTVKCGEGTALKVTQIQMEGKKSMSVESYLLGNSIEKGIVLG